MLIIFFFSFLLIVFLLHVAKAYLLYTKPMKNAT